MTPTPLQPYRIGPNFKASLLPPIVTLTFICYSNAETKNLARS